MHRVDVSEPISHSLEAFHSTISVMLVDKILTREEKRLIIKLASALGLNEDEPSQIYEAIRNGEEVKGGAPIDTQKAHEIYTKVFEIALNYKMNDNAYHKEWIMGRRVCVTLPLPLDALI